MCGSKIASLMGWSDARYVLHLQRARRRNCCAASKVVHCTAALHQIRCSAQHTTSHKHCQLCRSSSTSSAAAIQRSSSMVGAGASTSAAQAADALSHGTAAAAVPAPAAAISSSAQDRLQDAAAVVRDVLGTSLPLSQIRQIKMVVAGPCKMGISFWPMFSFKSPDREAKPGSARLITADAAAAVLADYQGLHAAAPTAVASVSGTGSSSSSSSTNSNAYTGSSKMSQVSAPQDQQQQQQLLLVDFTQDPPDEFSLGAKFLGGIPFPFLSIRTTQLKGIIDPVTGEVQLLFQAEFLAQLGSEAPCVLPINAMLTSETATALKARVHGSRLQHGHTKLVSAAEVPSTPNWFANLILLLPAAATAVLSMQLEFLQ